MSGDMISQYNDGFVFYSDNVLSVTDENLNNIDNYLFEEPIGLTLDGMVVSSEGTILDLKTGQTIENQNMVSISEDREYVTKNGLILVNGKWEDKISIFCKNGFVNFHHGRNFKTNLENTFIQYIYKKLKSILIYDDHIKVYNGELYSEERLNDLLDSEGEYDEDYAELVGIYNIDFTSIKVFPDHLMIGNNILDVNNNDCYRYVGYVLGIKEDYVVNFKGEERYKYKSFEIKNVL